MLDETGLSMLLIRDWLLKLLLAFSKFKKTISTLEPVKEESKNKIQSIQHHCGHSNPRMNGIKMTAAPSRLRICMCHTICRPSGSHSNNVKDQMKYFRNFFIIELSERGYCESSTHDERPHHHRNMPIEK